MSGLYMDYKLIEKYPNKYKLTPRNIKKLMVVDWDKLKKYTWYNEAMKDSGTWWCHLEGCELNGTYDDFNEFWIGFDEKSKRIECHFSCCEGMCWYTFDEFYKETENKCDLQVQVNAIRYLNMLIEEGILAITEMRKEKK